jgi:putative transposase
MTSTTRPGATAKTVLTEVRPVEIAVPRDRDGTFDPVVVTKRQRRLEWVDQIVLPLTARGLTTGEVAAHFADVYGASVSKDTISRVTEKVSAEMAEWATRPLDRVYPVMFIDAIRKSRSATDRSPTARSTWSSASRPLANETSWGSGPETAGRAPSPG